MQKVARQMGPVISQNSTSGYVVTRISTDVGHMVSGMMIPIFVCLVRLRAKQTRETDSARKIIENEFFQFLGEFGHPKEDSGARFFSAL